MPMYVDRHCMVELDCIVEGHCVDGISAHPRCYGISLTLVFPDASTQQSVIHFPSKDERNLSFLGMTKMLQEHIDACDIHPSDFEEDN